jgi:beta-lactamase regulating signal transducer with metallopeptidase domain
MNLLNQSAFLKALGWSLLDSLWQMGVLWLVYVLITANGKKFLSRQRHSIALLSLAGGSLWFLVTLVINFYKAAAAPEIITVYVNSAEASRADASLLSQAAGFFEPALPYLSAAYLLAAAFLFIRFYSNYRHTRRLFTSGLQKAQHEWRIFLEQTCEHMGIRKKVRIWLSSLVDTPLTLGFWKPIILLPVAAVNHLNLQQAEAIILHELNHIRRNDYLVNLLIACADIVLFFNPFARLLTSIIRNERENSCDDMVLQFRYNAHSYANALLTLEKSRLDDSGALTVAAIGKDKQLLLNRVKRILTNEPVTAPFKEKFIAYLLSALMIGFIGWYNPGKVIIRKIAEVSVPQQPGITETAGSFTTPPAKETMVAEAAYKPVQKRVIKAEIKNTADRYKTIRQIIEWTTDAKLVALNRKMKQEEVTTENLATFASASDFESVAFSLPQAYKVSVSPASMEVYPFVPSTSFSYQVMEDTALPKKYVMSYNELKAKETMDKALAGIQSIDWKKLEKEVNAKGKKINIARLQHELEKALLEVDWNKINEVAEDADDMAGEVLTQEQELLRSHLSTYQKERAEKQAKIKLAQQQILLERLQQHEELKKLEEKNKKPATGTRAKTRTRKIVHI